MSDKALTATNEEVLLYSAYHKITAHSVPAVQLRLGSRTAEAVGFPVYPSASATAYPTAARAAVAACSAAL